VNNIRTTESWQMDSNLFSKEPISSLGKLNGAGIDFDSFDDGFGFGKDSENKSNGTQKKKKYKKGSSKRNGYQKQVSRFKNAVVKGRLRVF